MSGKRALTGAIGALAAVAAVGGAATASAAPGKPAPGLVRFDSCQAFLGHARHRAMEMVGPWGLGPGSRLYREVAPVADTATGATAPSAAAPVSGVDFSGTNTQEAGVDEPDMVKTDGRTIFSLANGRVEMVDVTASAPRALGGIDLDGMYASGLILDGDRLVVLGDASAPGGGGIAIDVAPIPTSARLAPISWTPSTVVVQLDVADPAHPRVMARMKVDGSLVGARRTGDTVRVVLSSSPTRLPFIVSPAADGAAVRSATRTNRRILAHANATAWLPRLTLRDVAAKRTVRRAAVGCRSVSRPTEFAGLGMIDVLTLGVTGTMSVLDSDAVMTDGELVYASPTAMYVASTRWADPSAPATGTPPRGTTLIHKFDTSDPARTAYRASGSVRGYLLNQFSMSEQDGYLRTASTEEPTWWQPDAAQNAPESFVSVLADAGGRLARVGEVDGIGRGERIQSVRFLGTRGYVVTFKRTDPLFTLDLSDPTAPRVRGSLTMPGFSSYLHPVDADTLIGVGQAADDQGRTQGTQVSLFDVSDIDHPRRIAQRTLDTAWSEAETDHHAFLYWAPAHTLVLPVQSYGADGSPAFLGAVGLTVARDTGITPIARVEHPDSGDTWSPVRRSVVVGDSLYTVSDTGVMASALATLAPRGWVRFR